MFDDDIFGTDSLSLNSSRVDRMEIIGLVDFSQIQRTEDEGTPTLSETYGIANAAFISNAAAGVRGIVMKINSIIGMLEQDPKIQMCVNGREVQGLRTAMGQRQKIGEKNASVARTPNLLNSYAEIIIKTGLERARQNYNARLKELKKEAFAKIEEIIQKSGDISGGGMCYDKSAVGDIMK
jgi:hypothetical protein